MMMTLPISRPICLAVFVLLCASLAFAQDAPVVCTLTSIVREVQVTKAPMAKEHSWVAAKKDQGVHNGYGVRTLKRSLAELKFTDTSLLRVNERTDLVVQQEAAMRKIKLNAGAVWVKVVKGTNTSVETPTGTATAKGTIFVVAVLPDGSTRVTVLEGSVEVASGGNTVTVNAGESISISPAGELGAVVTVPRADLPTEHGGAITGWWSAIINGVEVSVTPGTPVQQDLRESQLPDNTGGGDQPEPSWYITDPETRQSFLDRAQDAFIPYVEGTLLANQGMTVQDFLTEYGGSSLATLELNSTDEAYFQSFGIQTIGDALNAVLANGGTITVDIVWPSAGRAVYRPGAVTASLSELRLLDQTRTSTAILAAGLAAGLLADRGEWELSTPAFGGWLYGFSGHPGFVGGRGQVRGLIGNTRYTVEGNALKFTNGPAGDWATRLASVAVVERDLGQWTLFAGRDRFYHGPVFQDVLTTQLIANRYSGAGLRTDRGAWAFEAAWLYDSNPAVAGAQSGALASLFLRAGGGVFGLHLLEADEIDDGHGRTVSLSYPLIRNKVDVYAEVGQGIDDADVRTFGLYLPALYQRHDIDAFIEYASHEGVGHAFSVIARKQVNDRIEARVYSNTINSRTNLGVGAIISFGAVSDSAGLGASK